MTILLFFAVLIVLVIVHELGHFSVAKWFGMRVDEFGVGFPPRITGVRRGETEYTLNMLPFGGFVRIFGENPNEDVSDDIQGRSFSRSSKRAQAAVLVAGVCANVLFAWVLLSAGFMVGMPVGEGEPHFTNAHDVRLTVTGVLPESPAADAGLKAGDVILRVFSGETALSAPTPAALVSFLDERPSSEVSISISRGGEESEISVTPTDGLFPLEPNKVGIGISMGSIGTITLPVHEALVAGASLTAVTFKNITVGLLTFFAHALTLQADFSHIAGPVGIATMVGDASALGVVYLLSFAAFISLNLAVINLIPFPALDGGRLLFVGIESLTGRAVPPRVFGFVNTIGFGLLLMLMIVVTYHDLIRLFV